MQAAAEDEIVVFLDSGTDASVAPADVPLSNLQKMVGSTVRTAGSEVIKDHSLGTINLGKGSDGNDIHLRVLQHPAFRVFLLSVSQLQCIPDVRNIDFHSKGPTVYTQSGKAILFAPLVDGQYQLTLDDLTRMFDIIHLNGDAKLIKSEVEPSSSSSLPVASRCFELQARTAQQQVWHSILHHLREKSLAKLLKPKKRDSPVVTGKGLTLNSARWDDCFTCAKAKQARRAFKRMGGERRATSILSFVSADLMGPFRVPTYMGGSYILLIKDEFTDRTWGYIIARKDDAADVIIAWSKRQHGLKGK